MALTPAQAADLRKTLVAVFGQSFADITPTEQTLELTETMFEEMHKCNRRIQILFQSLHCAVIGNGWLRRCVKSLAEIVTREPHEFSGCHNTALWRYKDPIYISGMNP